MGIERILKDRKIAINRKAPPTPEKIVRARAEATRFAGTMFPRVRGLFKHTGQNGAEKNPFPMDDEAARDLLGLWEKAGLVKIEGARGGVRVFPRNARAVRYLTGIWLEELVYLAAMEHDPDDVLVTVSLLWSAKGCELKNEIDVISLKRRRLTLFSCKSGDFDLQNNTHRGELVEALYEIDVLQRYLTNDEAGAALATTADLMNERAPQGPRPFFPSFHCRADLLGVGLIGQDDLVWDRLVEVVGRAL